MRTCSTCLQDEPPHVACFIAIHNQQPRKQLGQRLQELRFRPAAPCHATRHRHSGGIALTARALAVWCVPGRRLCCWAAALLKGRASICSGLIGVAGGTWLRICACMCRAWSSCLLLVVMLHIAGHPAAECAKEAVLHWWCVSIMRRTIRLHPLITASGRPPPAGTTSGNEQRSMQTCV